MTDTIYKYEPLWGEWKVGELLGKGSLGSVYKISKTIMDKEYFSAVKVITITLDQYGLFNLNSDIDEMADKQFFNEVTKDIIKEVDLLYKLKGHGNIISYEDHMVKMDEDENVCHIFIKMEYAKSLDNYIKGNHISEQDTIKIGIDICEALIACHENSILHRDIKEANIFRTDLSNYKLGDFSVSRGVMDSYAQTRVGTVYYTAPEIFIGKQYNHTIDIYSLGIVMYRLLNRGRLPFMPEAPKSFSTKDVEMSQNKRLAGEVFNNPLTGSSELAKIVLKACSYNAEDRYQSAAEMKNDLLELNREKAFASNIKKSQFDDDYQTSAAYQTVQFTENQTDRNINQPVYKNDKFKNIKRIGIGLLIAAVSIAGTLFLLKGTKGGKVTPKSSDMQQNILIELESPEPSSSSSVLPSGSDSIVPSPTKTENSAEKNLALNPGGESIDTSWKRMIADGSLGSAVFTDKEKYKGKSCFRIDKTNTEGTYYFYQKINVEKGKKYKLSAFAKTENLVDLPSSGACLKASYLDAANKRIYTRNSQLKNIVNWTFIECEFMMPTDSFNNEVRIYVGVEKTTGTAYFDDVKLVAGE